MAQEFGQSIHGMALLGEQGALTPPILVGRVVPLTAAPTCRGAQPSGLPG
jgi:hypothetical protein